MTYTGLLIKNKYRVENQLGEGGMGLVFKAKDIYTGSFAAIKFMKEKVTSSYLEDTIRFRHELQIIARLSHRNIIKVFDSGEYDKSPYIIMELLEGESLYDTLQRNVTFSIEAAMDIIHQIVDALNYVHINGIIHRDLKPGNIFLTQKEDTIQVKLLDFGVAHILELGEIKSQDEITGTFSYMSPEATGILNKRVDERSDLYSIGIIFYQLLTGEPPFKEKDVSRLLHQQVALSPVRPGSINTDIPKVLEDIIMKLLMKDPDSRYQSAKGLLFDIKRFIKGETEFIIGEKDQKVKLTYRTGLIGREKEMERIIGLSKSAAAGQGSVCLISGEAGVGKSRLIEEIKGYVYETNGLFIKGRCLNHANKSPYQPFKDAMDEFVIKCELSGKDDKLKESDRLKAQFGDLGRVLTELNPRVEKVLGITPKLVPLEPERENQRYLMVLSDFFCNMAGKNSYCVLFLDDLQWADIGSLNLLYEISRKISGTNLFILGTYRDNEVSSEHGLWKIKTAAAKNKHALEEINIQPFDYKKLNMLIENILGQNQKMTSRLTGYILDKSRGNPFFAIHIIRELIENKVIIRAEDHWEENWDNINEITLPENIIGMILKRLETLSMEQIDILCKAAVIGKEFETGALYRLMDISKERVISLVDDAISMHLLEESPERGRLLFVHDRIRDAFYQKINKEERKKLHLQIAYTIEALYEHDIGKVLFELVHHFIEGNDTEKSIQYLIPAAYKAKFAYANEESIRYFQLAVDIYEKDRIKNQKSLLKIQKELIDLYLLVGRNNEAIEQAAKIIPLMDSSLSKFEIYKKTGIAYFKKGDWKKCEYYLGLGLEILGEKIPRTKTNVKTTLLKELFIHIIHCFLPNVYHNKEEKTDSQKYKEIISAYTTLCWMYILSDLNKLLCNVLRSLNISEKKIGNSKELGMSLSSYAAVCMTIPFYRRAIAYFNRSITIRTNLNDTWGVAQSLQFLGYTYSWKGMHDESIRCFEKARAEYLKIGDVWEFGMAENGLGFAYYYTSEYNKAITFFNKYMKISHDINDIYGISTATVGLSFCSIETGDFETTENLIIPLLKTAYENKLWFSYCALLIYYGYLELEKGEWENAITKLEMARELYYQNTFLKNYTVHLFPFLFETNLEALHERHVKENIALTKSDMSKLSKLHKEMIKQTKSWANHYGSALRASANYYFLLNRTKKAEFYYLKSIEQTKRINRRYETAKGYYDYSGFLTSQKRNEEAKSNLTTAYHIFKDIGAKAYIKKCESLLDLSNNKKNAVDELTTRDRFRLERRMSTVLSTSSYISSILNFEELLEKIMDSAIELVGAERGILFLYPESGNKTLEIKIVRNVSRNEVQSGTFALSKSIISRIEHEKAPIVISDALADEVLSKQLSVVMNAIRSVICAPIISKGDLLGIIYLDNSLLGNLFNEDDLQVLSSISNQAGISIENARLYNKLKIYSKEIENSMEEIAKWNIHLEQRVSDRTKQLNLLNKELKENNLKLSVLYEQSVKHAATMEELILTKERNRFARDVHDTLGHTMTALITTLEVCRMNYRANNDEVEENLIHSISIAKEGLNEIRRSISGLIPEKLESYNLLRALNILFSGFEALGVNIDFSVDKDLNFNEIAHSSAVYKICQEALTNSIRHGKATSVNIVLKLSGGYIKLFISDNGIGCKNITKGLGLTGMQQRVEELNGTIVFGSDGDLGFNIFAEIPLIKVDSL